MNALVSHVFGLVPLLIPLEVCPKAPPGAQKYADDVMGYVLWGVGIVFFLGLVIAIASLVAGRIVNMPHATKMGIVGIVMVIVLVRFVCVCNRGICHNQQLLIGSRNFKCLRL